MPTSFPPPVNVSPLIRFGRYSMLLVGIGYGAFWQSRYTKKELALKDIKAREKAARDAQLAQEKAFKSADDDFIVVPRIVDPNSDTDPAEERISSTEVEPEEVAAKRKFKLSNENALDFVRTKPSVNSKHNDSTPSSDAHSEKLDSNVDVGKGQTIRDENTVIKVEDVKNILPKQQLSIEERLPNNNSLFNPKENGLNPSLIDDQSVLVKDALTVESVVKDIHESIFPGSQIRSSSGNKNTSTESVKEKDTSLFRALDDGSGHNTSLLYINNDQLDNSEKDLNFKGVNDKIPRDHFENFLFSHGPA